ncbi:MAG: hypothetical protein AB1489_11540 [Acidobacteriota bacterium]
MITQYHSPQTSQLVMIGGHSRNVGKTSAVEGIICALREFNWTAVKITQFGHGVCAASGNDCGCAVDQHAFAILEEQETTTGTDTARFLAAGARRSLWVRTKQGDLVSALPALQQALANDRFIIVESNSLRQFWQPTLYLQVLDPIQPDFKLSAQRYFDLADGYLLVDRSDQTGSSATTGPQRLLGQLSTSRPVFLVSPLQRFISNAVISFVKLKLVSS